ncbi:PIN domain-containing protein [Alkalicaulis satelles]|uniref:PIN domain-containing protein n=1 Tax=Alkalicaulis satelles TaxID=2609175 RepID=A0A5M6ZNM5_9PROT|nr:PIN domain-containing protein [Alkalicaulis satelles]KAA5805307.1 PIN domain-containing protein [Alkalicaulis satelles]
MITLDTNLYLYSVDEAEPVKGAICAELVNRAQSAGAPIALQVCGEFYVNAVRHSGRTPWEAAQAARNLLSSHSSFRASRTAVERALAEAAAGRFGYWDALLLASAGEAGCEALLTEDMADGARLGGVEVIHVFDDGKLSSRAEAALTQLESRA